MRGIDFRHRHFPHAVPETNGFEEDVGLELVLVEPRLIDVDARVAKAVKAGAKLMRPIFDVPNVGRIAILTEPGGAGIGWMTPSNK